MKVDEINNVLEVSRCASLGAAVTHAALVSGAYDPYTRDDAGEPILGDPTAIPVPAGLSEAGIVAFKFGVGHSMGQGARSRKMEQPSVDGMDAEKDPEAYAFISGAAAGWDQLGGINEAAEASFGGGAEDDDEPNFALDEDEDGLVAHEDDDGAVSLADNEDGAPETAPAESKPDTVANPDGSQRERMTFDKIAGGATDSPAAESGSSDS